MALTLAEIVENTRRQCGLPPTVVDFDALRAIADVIERARAAKDRV